MILTANDKQTGKQKFRPKMGKMSMEEYPIDQYDKYLHYEEEGYVEDKGGFPIFFMGHKKIVLGSTGHRLNYMKGREWGAGRNQFHKIPVRLMDHATFIIDSPQQSEMMPEMDGRDATQNEIMQYVKHKVGKKNKLVCANGRSMYDKRGKLHTIIGRPEGKSYQLMNHSEISHDRIRSLADRYLHHVLLKNSDKVNQFVSEVTDMIGSSNGISPGRVIKHTTDRVVKQVSLLANEQKGVMKAMIMDKLEEELTLTEDTYEMNFIEFRQQEARYQQEAYEKLAELRPKKDLIPPEDYQKMADRIINEADEKAKDIRLGVVKNYNIDLLSALEDVFTNLLLIAEVAGTDSENVVVMYPESHLRPLKKMIKHFKKL